MPGIDYESVADVLNDQHSVWVDVYRVVDGGQDGDGNPLPPSKHYYAQNARADLQPRTGTERAAQSGTRYESTHVLFVGPTPEAIPAGAIVDVRWVDGGPVVASYTVVFPGQLGTHWELDVKTV